LRAVLTSRLTVALPARDGLPRFAQDLVVVAHAKDGRYTVVRDDVDRAPDFHNHEFGTTGRTLGAILLMCVACSGMPARKPDYLWDGASRWVLQLELSVPICPIGQTNGHFRTVFTTGAANHSGRRESGAKSKFDLTQPRSGLHDASANIGKTALRRSNHSAPRSLRSQALCPLGCTVPVRMLRNREASIKHTHGKHPAKAFTVHPVAQTGPCACIAEGA
jgi:hypothetical protein